MDDSINILPDVKESYYYHSIVYCFDFVLFAVFGDVSLARSGGGRPQLNCPEDFE